MLDVSLLKRRFEEDRVSIAGLILHSRYRPPHGPARALFVFCGCAVSGSTTKGPNARLARALAMLGLLPKRLQAFVADRLFLWQLRNRLPDNRTQRNWPISADGAFIGHRVLRNSW